jgi:hypothetical protein
MIWIEEADGWIAAPEDIIDALGNEGFVGGVWQGVNRSTGSVVSTIWVDRASRPDTIVFVTDRRRRGRTCER